MYFQVKDVKDTYSQSSDGVGEYTTGTRLQEYAWTTYVYTLWFDGGKVILIPWPH